MFGCTSILSYHLFFVELPIQNVNKRHAYTRIIHTKYNIHAQHIRFYGNKYITEINEEKKKFTARKVDII